MKSNKEEYDGDINCRILYIKLKSLFKRDIIFVIIEKGKVIGIKNGKTFKRL